MPTPDHRVSHSRVSRPGGRLWAASITVLIAVGVFAGPAVTSALADSTGISGTVTDFLSRGSAPAVQVSVYDPTGTLVSSTCTGPDGGYTFGGLNPGDYRVGFESTQGNFKVCGGRTNYLPEFYDHQATLAAAQTVAVKAGATTPGIDAALEPGGAIAGRITDAATSAAVLNAEVDAFDGAGSLVSATCTAADGSYALFSLATGAYRVQVLNSTSCGNSTSYRAQFYDGQTTLANAHPVAVNVTQTTSGIDVALIPTSARTLTVTIGGPGTVGFSPSGVSCTRSCILPVTGQPTITLTGSPAPGYRLARWSGAGCSGTFVCTVRMTADQAVAASFVAAGSRGGSAGSGSGSGSGAGSGSGSGAGAGGGTPSSGTGSSLGCTLAVVSGRIRLAAPRRIAGRRRSRPIPPAVTVRYSCRQASRLSLRATFGFTTSTRAARGRHVRRRTHTAVAALAPRAVRAGSGTLTVRLPAAAIRALRSRLALSGRFDLRYSAARGSGTAVARVARLRTAG